MKTLIDWFNGEDIKYLYRLSKLSSQEAIDTIHFRQILTVSLSTISILALLVLAATQG